jgi:hypothetical protein
MTMDRVLMVVSALISLAALCIVAYFEAGDRREFQRIAQDIAEVRVSLQLFAQRSAPSGGGGTSSVDREEFLNLSNRLAVLEQNLRGGGGSNAAAPSPFEASPGSSTATTAPTTDAGDCMPQTTRFLVTTGDVYPICGADADMTVAAVGPSDVVLQGGGGPIPAGASGVLPGTTCIVSVLDAGDALGGYAEVRVAC